MPRFAALLSIFLVAPAVFADEKPRAAPTDSRLGKPRTLDDYHNLVPPASKEAWSARAAEVRRQVLIAAGLWPMPEKTPLNAVVHGTIDRGDYTVEKVYFQSIPGFYVTGNLYRPKGKAGPFPGVLCPHGHWNNGRFYANNDKGVEAEIKAGRESDPVAAKYPLQARCVHLARFGCVVFHYDMIGYADSFQIEHRNKGNTPNELGGPAADLWGVSTFGLQTWDSIRSLDFLLSLPDVDPKRISCTGASGGGTQTFILAAIDDRITVSMPAVMVSTGMQGGCQCENGHYLRLGTDNIELAAVFAPKPQLCIAATGDWTKELFEKGAPELRWTYGLFGAADKFDAVKHTSPHNYNKLSRESMYAFAGKHLLGITDTDQLKEKPFTGTDPKDLSVWDEKHPKPADALKPEELRDALIARAKARTETLHPKDEAGLARFREIIGGGIKTICGTELPKADDVEARQVGNGGHLTRDPKDGSNSSSKSVSLWLSRKGAGELVRAEVYTGEETNDTAVLVVGDGAAEALTAPLSPLPAEYHLLTKGGATLMKLQPFLAGDKSAEPAGVLVGGYNRTRTAQRVHDILTGIAYLKGRPGIKTVHLVGLGRAGVWCVMAKSIAGGAVARTVIENGNFHFSKAGEHVPYSLSLGGMHLMTAMAAPGELLVFNTAGTFNPDVLEDVYKLSGAAGKATVEKEVLPAAKIVEWLTRK